MKCIKLFPILTLKIDFFGEHLMKAGGALGIPRLVVWNHHIVGTAGLMAALKIEKFNLKKIQSDFRLTQLNWTHQV